MEIKLQNSQPIKYNEAGKKPVSFRGWQDQSDSTKIYVGNEVGSAISTAVSALVLAPIMHFFSLKLFSTEDIIPKYIVKDVANKMIKDNDLENKGFKASFVDTPEPRPTTVDSLKKLFSDHFNPATNEAFAHTNRPSVMLHEIGHAIDWNKSALSKFLVNTRFKALAVAGFLVPMAFYHKNSEQGSAGDWINKHIGTISFLSFVPTLITEASASKKGYDYLKKYSEKCAEVTPEMLKNFKIRMGWAFGTYAATALLTPIAIKLGVMVKDKMVSDNNNQEMKQSYGNFYNQRY